jgi:hypothetical protein
MAESVEDSVRRWIPEAEVKRLLKAIRASFCNSPSRGIGALVVLEFALLVA